MFIENNEGLNCFHLAARESNRDILYYLIENYTEYVYNRNIKRETFLHYLNYDLFIDLFKNIQI